MSRIFFRLVNDDLSPKLTPEGKRICSLLDRRGNTTIKIIGYFD